MSAQVEKSDLIEMVNQHLEEQNSVDEGISLEVLHLLKPEERKYESAQVHLVSPYQIRFTHGSGSGRALIGHLSSESLQKILPHVREKYGLMSFFSAFLPTHWIPRTILVANDQPDPLTAMLPSRNSESLPAPRGASSQNGENQSLSVDSSEQLRKTATISIILLAGGAVILILMYLRFAVVALKENLVVGILSVILPPAGWIIGFAISPDLRRILVLSLFLAILIIGAGVYLNPFFRQEYLDFSNLAAYRSFF